MSLKEVAFYHTTGHYLWVQTLQAGVPGVPNAVNSNLLGGERFPGAVLLCTDAGR